MKKPPWSGLAVFGVSRQSCRMAFEDDIRSLVSKSLTSRRPRILEAGGGKRCRFPIEDAHITVVDVDAGGLALNTRADEKVHADLETFDFGSERFDFIVCWDVLEHVKQPTLVLLYLIAALAPGGLILIAGPIPTSTKALLTRILPHSAHVAYYRHVMGNPKAGQPGYAPFETEFASGAADTDFAELLKSSGMTIVKWQRYETPQIEMLRSKSRVAYYGYKAASFLIRSVTLGRHGKPETDFWMLARRDAGAE